MIDRILQNAPATLTATFTDQEGVIVDPGAVSVSVLRADGETLASGAASGTEPAARTFALTAADTVLLDSLTVTWTSVAQGTVTTAVEIVGGFLFTVAEARATKPLGETAKYPTPALLEMRTTVEDAIEDYCGAMVPRYARETVQGRYGRPLKLSHPYVRSVRSVTVGGVDLSPAEVANITTDGTFLHSGLWPTGPVTVGYEHGRDRPPQRLRRAALLLAKVWLVSGPVDDRTSTFTSTEGGTYSLVTAGRGGSIFGVPEVDAAVNANRLTAVG